MEFTDLRKRMIEEQLIVRGIKEPLVLAAFQKVPRHNFIPEKYLDSAYADCPLPIGQGQTISQPYMVALMTECLELQGTNRVLEIGTGSGYQTAILAELAEHVFSVERIASLAQRAQKCLQDLGYQNIQIKVDDGTCGWPESCPYDRIIVTAYACSIPQPLIEQLKTGGKLIIPIGGSFNQILTVVNKHKDKVEIEQICGCIFVPLVGKYSGSEKNA